MEQINHPSPTPNPNHNYRSLDPLEVVETAQSLNQRILCRFPDSDLRIVSQQLLEVAKDGHARSLWIERPLFGLRLIAVIVAVLVSLCLFYSFAYIRLDTREFSIPEIVQAIEAGTSEIIILAAGLAFLISIESRIKRHRGLKALHELRAMAHIVDMHQLTKDPDRLNQTATIWTPVSPQPGLDAFHLSRYLDYCCEMLAIIGKVAALYAQRFADPLLLAGVDQIESLTSGLSQKIWQKIMIVHARRGPE